MTRTGWALIFLSALATSSAGAAPLTPVNPLGGGDGRERCLAGDLCPDGGAYAGSASILEIIRVDIGSGTTLARVDDGVDALWLNSWTNGSPEGQVQARARYAGDNSRLGYDTGTGYVNLLHALGDSVVSTGVADWVTVGAPPATPFAFVLDNTSQQYMLSSATGAGCPTYAVNCGSPADWMVTWQVTSSLFPHYIIAWEDRSNVEGGPNFAFSARPNDWDYNDYVFELRYVAPVPEPALMVLVGVGLLGAAARFRRR